MFISTFKHPDPNHLRILDEAYLHNQVVPFIAARWYDVGHQLRIPKSRLDAMKHYNDQLGSKCKEMLRMWISRRKDDHKGRPTWKNLYKAMEAVGLLEEVKELKQELMEHEGCIT